MKIMINESQFKMIISENLFPTNVRELINELPLELKNILFNQWSAKQNPEWHPEGNTLKHILVVLKRAYKNYPDNPNIILSALFHDLGKLKVYDINPKTGNPTAYGHEIESSNLVEKYKDWINSFEGVSSKIVYEIVKNHMKIKPSTWEKMRDFKKQEIINGNSYNDLIKFGTIDRGGFDI